MKGTLLLCLLLPGLAHAEPAQVERFYGYAFDLVSDRHLYTEVHRQEIDGERWVGGSIHYYAPDGTLIGEKQMDFSDDPYVPVYRLVMPQQDYSEAITDNGDPILAERRGGERGKVQRAEIARRGPMCADSGFHSFLHANFEQLMSGETLNFRLAVAGSLDAFRFRARRIGDTRFEERPAVRFRVEPDSLLRFVVDPLELTYDSDDRRLLEYRGVSNIRDPATGDPYVARIAYYSEPPKDIAALPPLDPECTALVRSC